MNALLSKAHSWSRTWGMNFNPSKTDAMFLSKKFHMPKWPVTFAGNDLTYVASHVHLGYTLSSDLSSTQHTDLICRKIAQQIFLLQRLSFKTRDPTTLREIYVRYIRPRFEYACPSWAALQKGQVERLEKLQRRAIRIILSVPYTEPIAPDTYDQLKLCLIHERHNFAAACYGYTWITGKLPRRLQHLMPTARQTGPNVRRRLLHVPGVIYPTRDASTGRRYYMPRGS